MSWEAVTPGTGSPAHDNSPDPLEKGFTAHLYANVARLFAEGLPLAPKPTVGLRTDGEALLYERAVNVLFGVPEAGKTLVASAIAADSIFTGGSLLLIDVDHNGAVASIARLRSFGISEKTLSDPTRFRYASPEDKADMEAVIVDATIWKPSIVILDSIGELLPMFGANSNDGDEYTVVHRAVLTRLADTGAAVIAIDHEAKGATSGTWAIGSTAKKRAVDGVMLRAELIRTFSPGNGGKSRLRIVKDRHGGLRAVSTSGHGEPVAATFELLPGEATTWKFYAPNLTDTDDADQLAEDVQKVKLLDPPPSGVQDVKKRCRWGQERATNALNAYKATLTDTSTGDVPRTQPKGWGTGGTHTPAVPEYAESTPEVRGTHNVTYLSTNFDPEEVF